jgi:hypothetical protein
MIRNDNGYDLTDNIAQEDWYELVHCVGSFFFGNEGEKSCVEGLKDTT